MSVSFPLTPCAQIDSNEYEWLQSHALQDLLSTLNADLTGEDEHAALIVGGAVRNAILECAVKDVDIATTLHPNQVIDIVTQKGWGAYPTGFDHGTVTVVIDRQSFEVTTLRQDVDTDGRRAVVAFTKDWREDAMRRDFTMNSLYMDVQGYIYDPLGKGWQDIQAGRLRFVGDAEQRIKEDALRILRFFRFWAYYAKGEPDEMALKACVAQKNLISKLSKERLTQEFMKILMAPRVSDALKIMAQNKVIPELLCDVFEVNFDFKNNNLSRLFYILNAQNKPVSVANNLLRLSNDALKYLQKMEQLHQNFGCEAITPKRLRQALYQFEKEVVGQYLLLFNNALGEDINVLNDVLKAWDDPQFPLTGQDLMALGYTQGAELGQEIKRLENEWIESDFKLTKSEILARANPLNKMNKT